MSDFVVRHYAPRAADYVKSTTHAAGEDLNDLTSLFEAKRGICALDLGCGGGHVSYTLAPFAAQVVAYDPTFSMLDAVGKEAQRRSCKHITPVCGFAESVPFPDNSFDAVVSRYSAHHWHDLDKGLAEARRVLRPGGSGVFVDTVAPIDPMADTVLQAIEYLRDPSHVRNFTVEQWREKLGAAGFELLSYRMLRLRLDFMPWVLRTRTPSLHQSAILSLQRSTSPAVRRYFEMTQEGSFTIDTALFVVQ